MNCVEGNCKFYDEVIDDIFCKKKNIQLSENIYDDEEWDCDDFEEARVCSECKHSSPTVYETGCIDDIEYRCPFQNNKLMYDDIKPGNRHFADMPICPIDKFE